MAYVDLATYLSYIEPVRLFYTDGRPYNHDSVFHYCSVDSFLNYWAKPNIFALFPIYPLTGLSIVRYRNHTFCDFSQIYYTKFF